MEFQGSAAVVTGGAKGIGRRIAQGLAAQGVGVVIGDLDQEAGAATARELGREGKAEVLFVKTDVAREGDINNLIGAAVERFGRLDYLVNNAGICPSCDMIEISLEEWDRVLNVNLRSVFLTSRAAAPIMRGQGFGAMVNISSVAGKTGGAAVGAHYSASKAGVISLTKTFAKVLAPHRVRVNAVCPGPVETDMTRDLTETARQTMIANSPLKAMAKPEEIAVPALFLLSAGASHITGEILDVNGGLWMD